MRTSHARGLKARGATPVFTDVKHRLRDWIESQVSMPNRDDDRTPVSLQEHIEECGYDESAYAYQLEYHRMRRIWQSEQDDYRDKLYLPQVFWRARYRPLTDP